jgi:histidyl-tRNA synthetase
MKRADRLKAKFCLILGGQEIDAGSAVLRNMSNKNQESLSLGGLEEELLRRLLK